MRKLLSIFLFLCFSISIHAGKYVLPDDLPTIEALIKLHKMMAKAEDNSVKQVGLAKVEEDAISDRTSKFDRVRQTLNSKLDTAYQWVYLATTISHVTLESYNAVKDYVAYTKLVTKYVTKKPQMAWYFYECNVNINREINLLKKSVVTLLATQTNLLKASVQQRIDMVIEIQTYISQIRSIISSALWWGNCVAIGGFEYDYIWDILNSDVMNGIVDDAVSLWDSNNKKYNANANI